MKTIMLHLCSPMHCYGMAKINGHMQVNLEPTKSAIATIIARAGGFQRNGARIKEIEDSITIEIKSYELPRFLGDLREKKNPPSITTDCQNFDEPISYIMDVYFRVWITGGDETIKQYALWLDDPEYILYCGEDSCIPSYPIFLMKENKHIFNNES